MTARVLSACVCVTLFAIGHAQAQSEPAKSGAAAHKLAAVKPARLHKAHNVGKSAKPSAAKPASLAHLAHVAHLAHLAHLAHVAHVAHLANATNATNATNPANVSLPAARPGDAATLASPDRETTAVVDTRASEAIKKEGGGEVKVLQISGLDIEGQLKTPQLLYFLNRLRAEFARPNLPHRSFMPELQSGTQEKAF